MSKHVTDEAVAALQKLAGLEFDDERQILEFIAAAGWRLEPIPAPPPEGSTVLRVAVASDGREPLGVLQIDGNDEHAWDDLAAMGYSSRRCILESVIPPPPPVPVVQATVEVV